MNGFGFSARAGWAWTTFVAMGGCAGPGVAPSAPMKGVILILSLLAACYLPARASQTELGAGIIVVSGTHTEQTGAQARANDVPAPMLHVLHVAGRFEFQLDAIPPSRASINGSVLGLNSTSLSYLDGTIRFSVARATLLGIGQMVYNQESLYGRQFGTLPISGTYVTAVNTTDRSRIVGLEFSVKQSLRTTKRSALSAIVAYAPSLRGVLGASSLYTWNDGTHTGGHWFATSEFGSQIDVLVDNSVRVASRAKLHYGLRYLNMSMHFSDGYLADRNAFFVPFVGWSTTLGR